MFGQIQYFHRGTIYRIINRKTKRCLSVNGPQITTKPYQDYWDQLWVLSEIKNDQFEIVQMKTGQVITWHQGKSELKLQKGKMKGNQLWTIDRAEIIDEISIFWIRSSKDINSKICGSAISEKIKVSTIDQTLRIALWQIKICPANSQIFKGLSTLYAQASKLVIDVPEHSLKEGTNLIQYRYHGCGNQRWIIQQYENKSEQVKQFTIKNYNSGLYLTASFTKLGFKATQSSFNCAPDQRWKVIKVKDNIYRFQSISNQNYFLGVNNDKGGSLIALTQQPQKAHWIIEGQYPQF